MEEHDGKQLQLPGNMILLGGNPEIRMLMCVTPMLMSSRWGYRLRKNSRTFLACLGLSSQSLQSAERHTQARSWSRLTAKQRCGAAGAAQGGLLV